MGIEFHDYSMEAKAKLDNAITAYLYEAAGELEAQVKRNTKVDTGDTKASWTYIVDESGGKAVVGSPMQNAIWEEFGTGEYAIKGNGRKTPWVYQDEKGNWHRTTGKKPKRAFQRAFDSCKNKLIRRIASILGDEFS
jgi:hypothetical protein